MIRGIDVSHYQRAIDWPTVAAAGYSFAWVKLTEGRKFIDPLGLRNLNAARVASVNVSGYHFARARTVIDAEREARHFLSQLPPDVADIPPMLPPALDLEATELGIEAGPCALAWLRVVEDARGKNPIVYVSPDFARTRHLERTPELAEYPLWVACWRDGEPDVPAPWSDYVAWQTGAEKVPGVQGDAFGRCDVNVARDALTGAVDVWQR